LSGGGAKGAKKGPPSAIGAMRAKKFAAVNGLAAPDLAGVAKGEAAGAAVPGTLVNWSGIAASGKPGDSPSRGTRLMTCVD